MHSYVSSKVSVHWDRWWSVVPGTYCCVVLTRDCSSLPGNYEYLRMNQQPLSGQRTVIFLRLLMAFNFFLSFLILLSNIKSWPRFALLPLLPSPASSPHPLQLDSSSMSPTLPQEDIPLVPQTQTETQMSFSLSLTHHLSLNQGKLFIKHSTEKTEKRGCCCFYHKPWCFQEPMQVALFYSEVRKSDHLCLTH